ncbi:MAG TPA: peptidylprolyl isomerase [Gammaproteobacteria bacterium]
MKIEANKVVSVDYTLKDDDGNILDTSQGAGPLVYLHGARNIIPGLESELNGRSVGEEISVRIPPEKAYGVRDDSMRQAVPRDMFGDGEIKLGEHYHAAGPDGGHLTVTVVDISNDEVTVDANHPLAGYHLNFDVKVVDVRDATQEELTHGHVHGPGGHHHG